MRNNVNLQKQIKLFFIITALGFVLPSTILAQPALPPLPPPTLNLFRFDTTNWLAGRGVAPLTNFGLTLITSFDTNAVKFSNGVARLEYPALATNGFTNITVDSGCLHFWFKPGFGSTNAGGAGLGSFGRLIELGEWTSNASIGWFSLYLDPHGTYLYFSGQTNGNGADYIAAPISWASNTWHYIGLNYTRTNTQLYLDGAFVVTNGPGVTCYPGPTIRTNSFRIGSDKYGTNIAKGIFENLRTYSGPFSVEYFNSFYAAGLAKMDIIGYGQNNSMMYGGGDDGGGGLLDGAEDGGGDLAEDGLRLVSPVISGTNMIVSITGAKTNELYDLYFSTNLINWRLLSRSQPMQTNFYMTQWPSPAGFFQLGTQLDSDGDSIPDAFELLITMTDPAIANTAASLGANSNLVVDVPSVLRVDQIIDNLTVDDLWDPCSTNAVFDPGHDRIRKSWKYGIGGTNIEYGYSEDCNPTNSIVSFSTNTWNPGSYTPRILNWHKIDNADTNNQTDYQRIASTTTQLLTGGPSLSNERRPYVITAGATEVVPTFASDGDYSGAGTNVAPTAIKILGLSLDSNGMLVAALDDNKVYDVTPSVTGLTNYTYSVNAQKVSITLYLSTSGTVTARETTNSNGQVVGYDASTRDGLTNFLKTATLGPGGLGPDVWFNFEETYANVPTGGVYASGWQFHRDVQDAVFVWNPSDPLNVSIAEGTTTNFTTATPGTGAGNDDNGSAEDANPDANGLIINCDAPMTGSYPSSDHSYPPGTVIARRFYAREWVTWYGARVSQILRWKCFTTLRRKSDYSWERKGSNAISAVSPGDSERPSFTPTEGQQVHDE